MKKILISFSTPRFRTAQQKLSESAENKSFDYIVKYTENDLDSEFYEKYTNIMIQSRGFGYWLWKPYIIKKELERCNYGDVVCYVDSSNIVLKDSSEFIFDSDESIKLFENKDSNPHGQVWLNNQWTKRDCFILMGCDGEKYWNGPQANASYQIYRKDEKSLNFVDELFQYCTDERILTDLSNSIEDNLPEFSDHRHDQSVLSLLAIKKDIKFNLDPSLDQFDLNGILNTRSFDHCRGRY